MKWLKNNLTVWHALALAAMLFVFTIVTFVITNAGVDPGADHNLRVAQATIGTITGPLTGAIARGLQSCCLRFSLAVMRFCAPVLLIGICAQFVNTPANGAFFALRMTLWTIGWAAWFLGGVVSFAHALS